MKRTGMIGAGVFLAMGLNASAEVGVDFFRVLGNFHMPAFQSTEPSKEGDKGVKSRAKKLESAVRFNSNAERPRPNEIRGWFAGRLYTDKGPVAKLLVGVDVPGDAALGLAAGKTLKLHIFGPDEPGLISEDYFDFLGSAAADGIQTNIRQDNSQWQAPQYTERGVVFKDSEKTFELRRDGDFLLCKYSDGGYGYFYRIK